MLPGRVARLIPSITILDVLTASAYKFTAQMSSQRVFVESLGSLPIVHLSFSDGIKSLAILALKLIVSDVLSPNPIVPSAVMFPFTCRCPPTNTSAFKSISPVPLVRNSKLAFDVVVSMTLSNIRIKLLSI